MRPYVHHFAQGKHEKAEDLYRQAIEIAEVAPGVEHPDYASRLTDLAGLLEKKVRGDVLGVAAFPSIKRICAT